MVLAVLFIIILHLFVRIAPIWSQRYRGSDAYYFLLTAELLRKQKKLPLILPDYYLLDITEQWYPPGFSVFLAVFPPALLRKYHWLVSPLLDLINLLLLLLAVGLTTHSGSAILVSGITYIFTLTLLLEGINLNARFLGNVQLTLVLLSLDLFLRYQQYWLLGLSLVAVMLVLFTHKMAFQFLCILTIIASLAYMSWLPLGLLLAAMALSFLISGGYYLKILRGHYDIVSFWNKYWPALGAHQVYDSPAYRQEQRSSLRNNLRLAHLNLWSGMRFLLAHQPFILPVLFLLYEHRTGWRNAGQSIYVLWFLSGIIAFLLTTYISKLKLFGEGYKYLKFTAFPGAFLLGTSWFCTGTCTFRVLLVIWAVVVTAIIVVLVYKYRQHWFEKDSSSLDKGSHELIEYLLGHPELDHLLCLPTNICDAIVYHARKHVLWGTHHYMFNELVGDFYPLLKYPLEFFIRKYSINCLVINKNYADPKDLGLTSPLAEFGEWAVYHVRDLRHI
ncbi:MAG: hypothetical protein PHV60_01625 [bacterium]|nr:hypothetical protein [bacterium]